MTPFPQAETVRAFCPQCQKPITLRRSIVFRKGPDDGPEIPDAMWSAICKCGAGVSLAASTPENTKLVAVA